MTICIAAACFDTPKTPRDKRIVLCSDLKWSSSLGSREGGLKQAWLPHNWACLTAGDESDIRALLRLYRAQFQKADNLTATAIDASIKAPLHQRKAELVEEYVQRHFGRSYDYFLKHGKDEFSAEHFFETMQTISRLRLNACLIIAGFINGDSEIYYTDEDGTAKPVAHYAVIGEGEYVASSSLLRRQQSDAHYLDTTLYHVFEAKKLAEGVPSVGVETLIAIMGPDGHADIVDEAFRAQMATWFKRYGPQEITDLRYDGKRYYKGETSEETK